METYTITPTGISTITSTGISTPPQWKNSPDSVSELPQGVEDETVLSLINTVSSVLNSNDTEYRDFSVKMLPCNSWSEEFRKQFYDDINKLNKQLHTILPHNTTENEVATIAVLEYLKTHTPLCKIVDNTSKLQFIQEDGITRLIGKLSVDFVVNIPFTNLKISID